MAWDHGYFSAAPYTCGVYRELSPAWLDLAALLKGQASRREREGDPFTYLELGSGMGLGLCLLAVAYPEGRFTGIDFQPDHIVHSRRLAQQLGLNNISFEEADVLSLAAAPGPLAGSQDYVVAHGMATWVRPPVQEALLELASLALRPGGLFYCSYNTFPGWLGATALQHLSEQMRPGLQDARSAQAVQQAAATLAALLGPEEAPSALAVAQPGLRAKLTRLARQNPDYLVQEYGNAGWQPLYVADLHRRCAVHKLRFLASATLPENNTDLLPASVRPLVQAESDPALQQTLQDLAINQSFRRDLFVRGRASLTATELRARLGRVTVRLQEAPACDTYRFQTSFGPISGDPVHLRGLESTLQDGPRGFDQLLESSGRSVAELANMLTLLLHGGRIGVDRGDRSATVAAQAANAVLQQRMRDGHPYGHLVAPAIGSGVIYSVVEALIADGLDRRLAGEALEHHLMAGLAALGHGLKDGPAVQVAAFHDRRPRLQALGVLP